MLRLQKSATEREDYERRTLKDSLIPSDKEWRRRKALDCTTKKSVSSP
ncbi:unnamed protein product [Arabidopsis lyrata]|nr:unnamed protein product [Arabidopsis lyrata]